MSNEIYKGSVFTYFAEENVWIFSLRSVHKNEFFIYLNYYYNNNPQIKITTQISVHI